MKPLARILASAVLTLVAFTASAQSTAFTYQGFLTENGGPANGVYDLRVVLWTVPSGGVLGVGTETVDDVGVTNGLFTMPLDFGSAAFNGNDRWLELSVRPGASTGAYTNLAPRQPVTSTPYAIRALNVGTNGLVAGTYANAVTLNNPANSFTGNGAGLSNVTATTLGGLGATNFWQTGGNGGTTAGTHFVGTTDNQPLEFKVNGARALRLEPAGGTPNVIGGAAANQISAPTVGAGVLGGASNAIGGAAHYSLIGGGWRQTNRSAFAFLGGGRENLIAFDSDFSVIAGGLDNDIGTISTYSAIGGGQDNNIVGNSRYAVIGGGQYNSLGPNSASSTVGGGYGNGIALLSGSATIAGGNRNDIGTNADYTTIGGGFDNNIGANSTYATIPGGGLNDIGSNANYSTIGGGFRNIVADDALYATIAGGHSNAATSDYATVAGGRANLASGNAATVMGYNSTASGFRSTAMGNVVQASGDSSTAMGYLAVASGTISTALGNSNTASGYAATALGSYTEAAGFSSISMGDSTTASGSRSTALGRRAQALHAGSFVWADSQNADFASTTSNQFNLRAAGGVRLSSDTPDLSFGSSTRQMINLWGTDYGIGVQSFGHYFRTDAGSGNFYWYRGGAHNNAMGNAGGGTTLMSLTGAGLTVNGAFIGASDRNLKENFAPVDARAVLDKVAALPLSEWNYKADTTSRHVGPMAQDFYAAFGTGADDKHIATVDADGVALAAIQGLNQKVEAQAAALKTKDAEVAALKSAVEELRALVLHSLPSPSTKR